MALLKSLRTTPRLRLLRQRNRFIIEKLLKKMTRWIFLCPRYCAFERKRVGQKTTLTQSLCLSLSQCISVCREITNKTTMTDPSSSSSSSSSLLFDMVDMIRIRRYAIREHSDEELHTLIQLYTREEIPDYQMAAWLMACCFQPLSTRETATLTSAMVQSGVTIHWNNNNNNNNNNEDPSLTSTPHNNGDWKLVDKHSTGGVGDKISILLAPLVASCCPSTVIQTQKKKNKNGDNSNSNTTDSTDTVTTRLGVPMMAGRGLGHTGGTIDKLESIPGYRTDLTVNEFQTVVQDVGCCISTTTPQICPADQKLYSLRDVTCTVSCIALQTSSILCKKIAERPHSLVLDVKYGKGSFQQTLDDAQLLATSMVATGEANGLQPTTALLTNMDHPIGCAVGNWLEIKECWDILNPTGDQNRARFHRGNADLITLTVLQAVQMIQQSNVYPNHSVEDLTSLVLEQLQNGAAATKFQQMVMAQGGDVSVLQHPTGLFTLPHDYEPTAVAVATENGYISNINALEVGLVSVLIGAGRTVAKEPVDPFAGIWYFTKVGDKVTKGTVMAHVFCSKDTTTVAMAVKRLQECIEYSKEPVDVPPIVSHKVTLDQGMQPYQMPQRLVEFLQSLE